MEDKQSEINKLPKGLAEYLKDKALSDVLTPYFVDVADAPLGGSTDVGDVF